MLVSFDLAKTWREKQAETSLNSQDLRSRGHQTSGFVKDVLDLGQAPQEKERYTFSPAHQDFEKRPGIEK